MAQREDITKHLTPDSIGVELGVATGQFSRRLLNTGRFARLYSIDAWNDGRHNSNEMAQAVKLLKDDERSRVMQARFDLACYQFADNYFDFIYIDGYAHTGQEQGYTLRDWWPKLKPGGMFSGDDYHARYPLVISVVNAFAKEQGLAVHLHEFQIRQDDPWGQCPSWFMFKPR